MMYLIISLIGLSSSLLIYFLNNKVNRLKKELGQTQYNLEQFKYSLKFVETLLDDQEKIHEKYADKISEHANNKLSYIELPAESNPTNTDSPRPAGVSKTSNKKNKS